MKTNSKLALAVAALMTITTAPAVFANAHEAPLQMINPYKGVESLHSALTSDFAALGITNGNVDQLTVEQLIAIEAVIVNQGDYAIKKSQILAIVDAEG